MRANHEGTLALPYYGALSARSIDPIEKKPLYHFLPGSMSYSIGFLGCNLRCPFCQNFRISQSTDSQTQRVSPEELVEAALTSGAASISYTYSEPLVHIEYILAAARTARKRGLKNVIVTNGMINSEAAQELYQAMDAANIDLKSFSSEYYQKTLKGDLDTVLRSIEIAYLRLHLELTTLIVPGDNDSPAEFASMLDFISSLSNSIPWHLSRYFPRYRETRAATPEEELLGLGKTAARKLQYVYLGNMDEPFTDTRCPSCRRVLISRSGRRVRVENQDKRGCDECGQPLPYIS